MSTQTTPRGPANSDPNEPTWTTGQGIGFLVSLTGWILAVAGLIGVMVTASAGGNDEELTAIFGLLAGLGVISAIPGTVVFHKCKRRPLPTGAVVLPPAQSAQDDVILAAALELSHAIHRKRLQTGEKTVPRKFASLHLTDELRKRAEHQGVDLPSRAVERAIKMGWLASEGVGAHRVLSRTSTRLPDMPQS